MRDVFVTLDRLGIRYYITGSEALPRYGEPRQTMDVDVVIDVSPTDFSTIARAFEQGSVVTDPIDTGAHVMASLIPTSALGKVDLILSRDDAWSRSAMERRRRWEHPEYGPVWIASLEDLILAKLAWSSGTSELQLRDCRNLMVVNRQTIDWKYLERWAASIGMKELLAQVRDEA